MDVPLDALGPDRHGLHVCQRLRVGAILLLLRTRVDGLAGGVIPKVGEVGKGD